MKVLIIDDDPMVLETLGFYLKRQGYEVIKTLNCANGVEILENSKIDLIISDVMMPYMSGLMFYNLIKQTKKIDIPILLTSSLDNIKDLVASLKINSDIVVGKPINYEDLNLKIRLIFEK